MKKKKRVLFVAVGLTCLGLIWITQPPTTHYAEKKEGNLTIQLTDTQSNYPKENVKFGLEKIAEEVNGKYLLNKPYQDIVVNINDLKTDQKMIDGAKKIKRFITQPSYVVSTDKAGKAKVDHLPVGVYLGYVIDEGEYEQILPFLIAISSTSYNVTVLPKHEEFPMFRLSKMDALTHRLIEDNTFEYTLFSDEACTDKMISVSNENKSFVEMKIPYGIGYIRETQSPRGYLKSNESIKVELNQEGFYVNEGHVVLKGKAFYSFVFGNEPINRK